MVYHLLIPPITASKAEKIRNKITLQL